MPGYILYCYYSQEPFNDSSISYICIEIRGQIEKVDVSLFSGRSTWGLIMYVFILKWVLNFFFLNLLNIDFGSFLCAIFCL